MPYRKVCPGCQKEFTSDDRQLIERLIVCDECWTALPDAVEEIGAAVEPTSTADSSDHALQTPTPDVSKDSFDAFASPANRFPTTETPSNPLTAREPKGATAQVPDSPATAQVQAKVHELHWVGTNRSSRLPVILPDALDGGYVGRDASLCVAEVNLPTVSRIQFAYRNAEGGPGIEITDLGQFGTWVNGRLLRRNESAVAPPGSIIEMGGFEFELREGT